jgi:hypothetical protein
MHCFTIFEGRKSYSGPFQYKRSTRVTPAFRQVGKFLSSNRMVVCPDNSSFHLNDAPRGMVMTSCHLDGLVSRFPVILGGLEFSETVGVMQARGTVC